MYLTESKFESIINALFGNVGLTIIQDELNGFFRRITRSGERQRFLSLWSSEPILTVRQSNPTFWLRHPVVSIVGGIQPSLIPDLWSHNRDGLIERFLLVLSAADQPIQPDSTAKPMSPSTLGEVTLVLLKLRGLGGRFERSHGIVASPTPEAAKRWQSWLDQNTDLQRNAPESLKGFYRKLPAHVARLALILHAIHNPDKPGDPMELATMTNAIELGEFFRHHLLRTVELIGNRTGSAATKIPLPDRIVHLLAQTDAPEGWLGRTAILIALGRPDTSGFNTAVASLTTTNQIENRIAPITGSGHPTNQYRLRQLTSVSPELMYEGD